MQVMWKSNQSKNKQMPNLQETNHWPRNDKCIKSEHYTMNENQINLSL